MEKSKSGIAFFDFDGTLTKKDSMVDFIQFSVGKPLYWLGLLVLLPPLLAWRFGLMSNHIAKEKLISHFFDGWDSRRFQKLADRYSTEHIDRIIRPAALNKLRWHKDQGHQVVIASASMDSWLQKWSEKHGIDLIATQLEVRNGKLTGRFASKNCHGIEKVNRIRQQYDLDVYGIIYAYGNSPGDKEMLGIADQPFYRCFQ